MQGKKSKKRTENVAMQIANACNCDRLAKLEVAAASRSGTPRDQAVELADATPEAGASARAVALRRVAMTVLGAEAVALLGAEQRSELPSREGAECQTTPIPRPLHLPLIVRVAASLAGERMTGCMSE